MLLFLFSVWLAFWVAKTVRLILQDEVLPKMSLPRGVGNSISSLTYYAMVIIGLFVALAAAGFEVSQLAIVVGALGVGIGFGLQNVVNNFVSGLILMFERPIQPGDVVEVGGHVGQGARDRHAGDHAQHLRRRGRRGAERHAAVREADQLDAERHGPPHRRQRRRGLRHGSGQGAAAADGRDPVDAGHRAPSREPTVLFVGFGANSLDFSIRAWTNDFDDWVKIRSDLTVRVYDALKDAGIEIPFPQHDLHLRSVSPGASAALAGLKEPPPPPTSG